MNIDALQGKPVVFKHPNAGYERDQRVAREHLKLGASYTIESTEVGNWHTDVYLVEVPGVAFNSVLFDNAS